jgi:hypothetical protein
MEQRVREMADYAVRFKIGKIRGGLTDITRNWKISKLSRSGADA